MYLNRSNAVNTIYKIDYLRSFDNATVSSLLTDRLVDVNIHPIVNAILVLLQKFIPLEIAKIAKRTSLCERIRYCF